MLLRYINSIVVVLNYMGHSSHIKSVSVSQEVFGFVSFYSPENAKKIESSLGGALLPALLGKTRIQLITSLLLSL